MGNHSGAESTSEGGHRDTHLWETSRQDRRVHEVYDRLTRIAKEANSGRGVAECVSVPEEPYEGNPHVRFCEGGAGHMACIPLLDPVILLLPVVLIRIIRIRRSHISVLCINNHHIFPFTFLHLIMYAIMNCAFLSSPLQFTSG